MVGLPGQRNWGDGGSLRPLNLGLQTVDRTVLTAVPERAKVNRGSNSDMQTTEESKQVRIQILAPREETGRVGRAIAAIGRCRDEFAAVAGSLGAEAVLVCPAPEESAEEGIDIVVAARFAEELDEETIHELQLQLMQDVHDVLGVEAVVVDLDTPLEDLLEHIEPMLAAPYRNELGSRETVVQGG
jgi:hypothetical protein